MSTLNRDGAKDDMLARPCCVDNKYVDYAHGFHRWRLLQSSVMIFAHSACLKLACIRDHYIGVNLLTVFDGHMFHMWTYKRQRLVLSCNVCLYAKFFHVVHSKQ